MADQWQTTSDHAPPTAPAWQSTSDHSSPDAKAAAPPGPASRLWDSFVSAINPIPGFQEWLHRGEERKKMFDGLHVALSSAGREMTPDESAKVDTAMGANVSNPTAYIPPPLSEPALQATGQAQQGNLAGAAGTLAGGYAVPAVAGKLLNGRRIPIVPKVVNPNVVEAAAVRFGQENGIPVSAATASGNKFIAGTQALADHSPIGSFVAQNAKAAEQTAFHRVGDSLMERVNPEPVVPEQAGSGIRSTLERESKDLANDADNNYTEFRRIEADPSNVRQVQTGTESKWAGTYKDGKPVMAETPITAKIPLAVDMGQIQKDLAPIMAHAKTWIEPAKVNASAGLKAVKSIVEGPRFFQASDAEIGLGGLKALERDGDARSAGMARMIIPKLQAAIDAEVAKAGPDAIQALQDGRAATAQKYTVEGVIKQLRAEPVQAFGQMMYRKDSGINLLRQVAEHAPDELPKIGRAYLEDVLGTQSVEGIAKGAGMFDKWDNLGKQTKLLFYKNPMLIEDLDHFFLLAKKAAEHPNPSGSAVVGSIAAGLGYAFTHPATGVPMLIGTGALSKLLHSPAGVKALSKGLSVRGGTVAGTIAAGAILKASGDAAKPVPLAQAAQNTSPSEQNEPQQLAQLPR